MSRITLYKVQLFDVADLGSGSKLQQLWNEVSFPVSKIFKPGPFDLFEAKAISPGKIW